MNSNNTIETMDCQSIKFKLSLNLKTLLLRNKSAI